MTRNQFMLTIGLMLVAALVPAGIAWLPSIKLVTTTWSNAGLIALIVAGGVAVLFLLNALLRLATISTTSVTTTTVRTWDDTWKDVKNWSYVLSLVFVLTLVGWLTWLLYTAGIPGSGQKLPSSDVINEYIWWQPSLPVLLQVLGAGLIFLWFAPPANFWLTQLIKALMVLVTFWYLVNAIATTGFATRIKESIAQTDACLKDDSCAHARTMYQSGSTIYLGPHIPKEDPKIFRFNGRIVLYNARPCTQPMIEYAGAREYEIVPSNDMYRTILLAKPGKTVEVHVWLRQIACTR